MQHCRQFLGMLLLLTLASLLAIAPTARADDQASREYDIKAAYLYHFVQYAQLPPRPGATTITVGILGGDPSGGAFDVINGKVLNGKRLVVRQIGDHFDPRAVDVLFISDSEKDHLRQIFAALAGTGVLTVGETKGFAQDGGMINFYMQDNRVRFAVNPAAAGQQGIHISSQVLRLARIVHG